MWTPPPEHPLRRTFAGLAEHAFFSDLGVADPPLIDYLSALLARFIHNDEVYRLRGLSGRPLTELAEMVVEAERLVQYRSDRARGAQRRVGILERHLYGGAQLRRGAAIERVVVRRVDAADADDAGGGILQSHDAASEGGLAGAGFSDDADALASTHLDRDAVERDDRSASAGELLAEAVHGEEHVGRARALLIGDGAGDGRRCDL